MNAISSPLIWCLVRWEKGGEGWRCNGEEGREGKLFTCHCRLWIWTSSLLATFFLQLAGLRNWEVFFSFLVFFFVRVGGVLCVCVVFVFVGRGLDE